MGSNWSRRTRAVPPHALLFLSIFPWLAHFAPEQSCLTRQRVIIFFRQPPTPLHSCHSYCGGGERCGQGQKAGIRNPLVMQMVIRCAAPLSPSFSSQAAQSSSPGSRDPAEVGRGHPCSDPCRQDSFNPCLHF